MLALTDNEAEVKPELRKIMNSLPTTEGNNATIEGQLSLGNLLPADSSYWTYQGSLTTPYVTLQTSFARQFVDLLAGKFSSLHSRFCSCTAITCRHAVQHTYGTVPAWIHIC